MPVRHVSAIMVTVMMTPTFRVVVAVIVISVCRTTCAQQYRKNDEEISAGSKHFCLIHGRPSPVRGSTPLDASRLLVPFPRSACGFRVLALRGICDVPCGLPCGPCFALSGIPSSVFLPLCILRNHYPPGHSPSSGRRERRQGDRLCS